jgi:hypothetical protein
MKSGEIHLINSVVCKISGLSRGIGEVCMIVSCYTVYAGNCRLIFWDIIGCIFKDKAVQEYGTELCIFIKKKMQCGIIFYWQNSFSEQS